MDLMKVYNQVENPLTQEEIMKIIYTYSMTDTYEEFIERMRVEAKDDANAFIGKEKRESIYTIQELTDTIESNEELKKMLFKTWIQDLKKIDKLSDKEKEEFYIDSRYAISKGKKRLMLRPIDIEKSMREILNKAEEKDLESYEDITKFINELSEGSENNKAFIEALSDLSNEPNKELFRTIKSNYVVKRMKEPYRYCSFLMVRPAKTKSFEFIKKYIEKCNKYKIEYNINLDAKDYDGSGGSIVSLKSTMANLGTNLVILDEIGKENPELKKQMQTPPTFTGKVNEWVGIGNYPGKESEMTDYIFTDKRAKIAYEEIEKYSKLWVAQNAYKVITVDNMNSQKMTIKTLLSQICTNKFIKDLREIYKEEVYAKGGEDNQNRKNFRKKYGFYIEDLGKASYQRKMLKWINKGMNRNISDVCYWDSNETAFIVPDRFFGIRPMFEVTTVYDAIRKLSSAFAKGDEKIPNEIGENIKARFKEEGIDDKKPCFETYVVQQMEAASEKEKRAKQSKSKAPNKQMKHGISNGNKSREK